MWDLQSHIIPKVNHDDSIAALAWRLIRHIVKQRSLSNMWHVSAAPGVWAGFLGDERQQAESMESFRSLWESFTKCKQSRIPEFMEAVVARQRVAEFQGSPGRLSEMCWFRFGIVCFILDVGGSVLASFWFGLAPGKS